MTLLETKGLTTCEKWERIVETIPETSEFASRAALGKKQSADFGLECYKAGIRDALTAKTSASR